MAANPRRFRLWPTESVAGVHIRAFAEGCLFTDGTVVVRFLGGAPTSVVYPDHGIAALEAGVGFGGPAVVEWLDGAHSV